MHERRFLNSLKFSGIKRNFSTISGAYSERSIALPSSTGKLPEATGSDCRSSFVVRKTLNHSEVFYLQSLESKQTNLELINEL